MKTKFPPDNLFHLSEGRADREIFKTLFASRDIKIERIVSLGQVTPAGKWLKQRRNEWVLLLRGEARLRFGEQVLSLKSGDHLFIPAGTRHRVEWTPPHKETLWLAVHFKTPTRVFKGEFLSI